MSKVSGRMNLLALTAMFATLAASAAQAATYRFDNNGGDGLWENGDNWRESSGGTYGTLPGTSDIADISSAFTATLSTPQTVSELVMGWPNGAGSSTNGTATLNVLPGANLTNTSTNGMRIGRALKAGGAAGDAKGVVIQTGGTMTMTAGTNGLRLSQADSGAVGDSLYRISGGSVRGGATNGAMTAPLQIGSLTNSYVSAEFHILGSAVTEARFDDVRMQGNSTGSGEAILHFTLDAGGVTTLIAEDEMRFAGTGMNKLVVDMIGLPPEQDIFLIQADRLNTASSAPGESFTGMPDGTDIATTFGPNVYNWKVRYQDGSDDGVLDAFVKLEFVSSEVPEPSALALAGVAGLLALRRRGRRAA